ncbi:hypothetical protein B0T20DRAFT_442156 [Sordaria brevicollis]|uniref:Uncharacterized protein n=1 Tax=Sordaria brevicollis TaxID=83679 RepID=A0AAE0PAN5_SORBR|nr:hypothetical protein B0T20DRAFT_442156 [Sordaria brevicollis]
MLVRPPTSPFGGATIGLLSRCSPRSVPVSNIKLKSTAAEPPVNHVNTNHGLGPSQKRWQSQLLRLNPSARIQAQAQTPRSSLNGMSGRRNAALQMRLIGIIRLASTSNSPAAAQKRDGEGEVGVGKGDQSQTQRQGAHSQGQLPSTGNAANGVPQLKAPKLEYPERLLIYNAGKGKVMFIAFLKLTTIFIFVAFGLVLAPTYIINGSPLEGIAVFTCGLTPMLFLAHASRPFVAQIHLTKMPPYARLSSDVLLRFVRSLPPQSASRLEFTTMSLIGKARGSSVAVSELRPVSSAGPAGYKKSWFRSVNFVRVGNSTPSAFPLDSATSASSAAATGTTKTSNRNISKQLQQVQERQEKLRQKYRQGWRMRILNWTRYKKVNEFYVTDVPQKTAEKRGVKEARVWEEIRGLIEKRAVREAEKRGNK